MRAVASTDFHYYLLGTASFLFFQYLSTTAVQATFFSITNVSAGFSLRHMAWLAPAPASSTPYNLPLCLFLCSIRLLSLSPTFISSSRSSLRIFPSHSSPPACRRPTTAAGVHGVLGVRAPGRAEGGCSSPSVCATTRHRETTDATAREREPSIGPAALRHVQHRVSVSRDNGSVRGDFTNELRQIVFIQTRVSVRSSARCATDPKRILRG